MNLSPLLDAPLAIQIHVATVLPAAAIGPYMFLARKATPLHRLMGKVWLGLMVIAAASSFFIHEINLLMGFSPIHLISAYVLVGVWLAYRSARQHMILAHKRQVLGLYFGGIVGAGAFTLLPGRIMNEVIFTYPENWPDAGRLAFFVACSAGATLLLVLVARFSTPKRA
ncbi:MAG: hypothetical protein JWM58_3100 [Rhizobium sp.]|nr:hypothetical protein [Rhizobium sp.]